MRRGRDLRAAARPRAGDEGGPGVRGGERGQAAVELLALVPLLLAVALAAAQVLAVGYASVLAGNAAEAGALTLAGGGDARAGARAALPGWSRARARVSVTGGTVRVDLRPPALLRARARELEVSATAAVEAP
jgi:Flp pilus assembly protein TadG